MASNMFVRFDTIEGEAEYKDTPAQKNWCEITSLKQNFENEVPPLLSGDDESGPRRGKHAPVEVSKLIDKASLQLMEKCWDGEALEEVEIHCFRAGLGEKEDKPIRYISIKLESVIIKKFAYKVSEGSLVTEDLELKAAKATYQYRQMHKKRGTAKLTGTSSIELRPEDFTDAKTKIDFSDLDEDEQRAAEKAARETVERQRKLAQRRSRGSQGDG